MNAFGGMEVDGLFYYEFTSKEGGAEEKGVGGAVLPLSSHNRRKPARGIPQAELTYRLEVSGATLSLTAASHRPPPRPL